MHFSSKISNSILVYMERQNVSLDGILSVVNIPEEFLRDPSTWIEAPKMEEFLRVAQSEYQSHVLVHGASLGTDTSLSLVEEVGSRAVELMSWGVLDGVLRMIQKPQDLYSQPERLIAYFVSPPPPLGNLLKKESNIEFDIPLAEDDWPHVTRYLRSALETIPLYFQNQKGTVSWVGTKVKIDWREAQSALKFDEQPALYNPKLVDSLVAQLEQGQKELEKKNRQLVVQAEELDRLKKQLEREQKKQMVSEKLSDFSRWAQDLTRQLNHPVAYSMSHVHRLSDYFIRATQLITLLVGQGRMSAQVQQAMKRTDWEFVGQEFPRIIHEIRVSLDQIQNVLREFTLMAGPQTLQKENARKKFELKEIIQSAIRTLEPTLPRRIQVEQQYYLEGPVDVLPGRMEQALVNLLNFSTSTIDGEGQIRVSTRPLSDRAQIEISDTGQGLMTQEFLDHLSPENGMGNKPLTRGEFGLSIARSIVEMHEGELRVHNQPGRGTTFIIDLPLS